MMCGRPEQLAPFTEGGKQCARLVTTRVPELLAGRGTAVRVDQMSAEQARALLTSGLPPLDEAVVAGLLAVTGRWPLLLRLVNKILADYAQVAADVAACPRRGRCCWSGWRAGGPAVVDELASEGGRGLDVGQPDERARAVRATIGASTGLLDGQEAERFAELGVFAEDETIPFSLVARLWRATAGLDELRAAQVCKRLAQLALVSQVSGPGGGIALHDVIRDFLRAELGRQRLARLNGMLLDAARGGPARREPAWIAAGCPVRVAWWELGTRTGTCGITSSSTCWMPGGPVRRRPLRVTCAGSGRGWSGSGPPPRLLIWPRPGHRARPGCGPCWHARRTCWHRPSRPGRWWMSCTAGSPTTRTGDRKSPPCVTSAARPRLVNRWPLPDLADPALRRVLTGHTGRGGSGGGGAGWQLAGLRQRRRDGADLGRGHRAGAGHPDRPHRRR